jgi:hypothetical protein
MRTMTAILIFCAFPAFGEPHKMAVAFAERPCGEAIDYIDNPILTPEGIGNMGMAFGYLLGFEAANGGDLSGDAETVLQRIKADCVASPDMPALDLLRRYLD